MARSPLASLSSRALEVLMKSAEAQMLKPQPSWCCNGLGSKITFQKLGLGTDTPSMYCSPWQPIGVTVADVKYYIPEKQYVKVGDGSPGSSASSSGGGVGQAGSLIGCERGGRGIIFNKRECLSPI